MPLTSVYYEKLKREILIELSNKDLIAEDFPRILEALNQNPLYKDLKLSPEIFQEFSAPIQPDKIPNLQLAILETILEIQKSSKMSLECLHEINKTITNDLQECKEVYKNLDTIAKEKNVPLENLIEYQTNQSLKIIQDPKYFAGKMKEFCETIPYINQLMTKTSTSFIFKKSLKIYKFNDEEIISIIKANEEKIFDFISNFKHWPALQDIKSIFLGILLPNFSQQIKNLNFRNWNINDKDVDAILPALDNMDSLETFVLTNTNLTNDLWVKLLDKLFDKSESLKEIEFNHTNINDECFNESIIEKLSNHTYSELITVNLVNNQISINKIQDIIHLIYKIKPDNHNTNNNNKFTSKSSLKNIQPEVNNLPEKENISTHIPAYNFLKETIKNIIEFLSKNATFISQKNFEEMKQKITDLETAINQNEFEEKHPTFLYKTAINIATSLYNRCQFANSILEDCYLKYIQHLIANQSSNEIEKLKNFRGIFADILFNILEIGIFRTYNIRNSKLFSLCNDMIKEITKDFSYAVNFEELTSGFKKYAKQNHQSTNYHKEILETLMILSDPLKIVLEKTLKFINKDNSKKLNQNNFEKLKKELISLRDKHKTNPHKKNYLEALTIAVGLFNNGNLSVDLLEDYYLQYIVQLFLSYKNIEKESEAINSSLDIFIQALDHPGIFKDVDNKNSSVYLLLQIIIEKTTEYIFSKILTKDPAYNKSFITKTENLFSAISNSNELINSFISFCNKQLKIYDFLKANIDSILTKLTIINDELNPHRESKKTQIEFESKPAFVKYEISHNNNQFFKNKTIDELDEKHEWRDKLYQLQGGKINKQDFLVDLWKKNLKFHNHSKYQNYITKYIDITEYDLIDNRNNLEYMTRSNNEFPNSEFQEILKKCYIQYINHYIRQSKQNTSFTQAKIAIEAITQAYKNKIFTLIDKKDHDLTVRAFVCAIDILFRCELQTMPKNDDREVLEIFRDNYDYTKKSDLNILFLDLSQLYKRNILEKYKAKYPDKNLKKYEDISSDKLAEMHKALGHKLNIDNPKDAANWQFIEFMNALNSINEDLEVVLKLSPIAEKNEISNNNNEVLQP